MKHLPINTHIALLAAKVAIDKALFEWTSGASYADMHGHVKAIRKDLKRLQRHTGREAEIDAMTKGEAA